MINIVDGKDISLVKQKNQKHYVKVQFLNRSMNSVGTAIGKLVSGNITIDESNASRRSASISMVVVNDVSFLQLAVFSVNYFVQIQVGIENNFNKEVSWYKQGIFIISQGGLQFDSKSRTLNLTLSDLMQDVNGERAGVLDAYQTIAKNSQRIDVLIKNVMSIIGYNDCNIVSIGLLRGTQSYYEGIDVQDDFLVPYDLSFPIGATAYDIVSKCVDLYPYFEMYFDIDGVFTVDRKQMEDNSRAVVLDANNLNGLVVSEDKSVDFSAVKNYVKVWGKDGKYYGEAKDDNPDSPFNPDAVGTMLYVVTDSKYGVDVNNICDRYKDTDKQKQLLIDKDKYEKTIGDIEAKKDKSEQDIRDLADAKEYLQYVNRDIQMNISYKGNDLAEQWAKRLVYEMARMNDSITLQTIMMPFINDTGFKISYRSKSDDKVQVYVVKSVSHDLAAKTTTLNCIRFYNDQCEAYLDQLDAPTINSCAVSDMTITVSFSAISNAQYYSLYVDGKKVADSTGTTISYTAPEGFEGERVISVTASAENYRRSAQSNYITVELSPSHDACLVADTNRYVTTDSGDIIIIAEGEEE